MECKHGAIKSLCPLCSTNKKGFDLLGNIRGQKAVFALKTGLEPNVVLLHPSARKYVPVEYRELQGLEIDGLRVVEDVTVEPKKIIIGYTLKN